MSRFALSFDALCLWCVAALIALRVLLMPVAPHDFWWQMAMGREIVSHGAIPTHDTFSWTQNGQPFFDQGWLAQLVFYGLHTLGGVPLLLFFQAILLTACYALLGFLLAQHSSGRIAALLLAATMLVSFDNWLLRPQSYAIPLFIACVYLLHRYRIRASTVLWPLPLLMILWTNLHGSFPLGLLLILLALLGEAWTKRNTFWRDGHWQRLALWGAVSMAAMLCNPRGLHVLSYVAMMFASPSNRFSAEWLSPNPRQFGDALFFVFATAVFTILIFRQRRPDATSLLNLLVFWFIALLSGRYILWFAIIAPLVLAQALQGVESTCRKNEKNSVNTAMAILVWLLPLAVLPWWKSSLGLPPPWNGLLAGETPVRAVQVLSALPATQRPRRLFHNEASGSYLCWAAPQQKVFIDTRFELYPPQQWRDLLQLNRAANFAALQQKYRFDGFLLDVNTQRDLLKFLQHDARWRTIYQDKTSALLLMTP